MARGKNTTVKTILSNVRVKTGTVIDDRLTEGMLLDLLNMNVTAIARRLSKINAPIYMTTAALTLASGAYSTTSLAIEQIIKLVDGTLGQISFVPPQDFERASAFATFNTSSLIAVQEGESIRIFKGATLGVHGTITLYYYQIPTYATVVTEYPDLPDSFTSLLVKMICADVYSYLNKGQRDTGREQEIAGDFTEIEKTYGVAA